MTALPTALLARPAPEVAYDLLGRVLVHEAATGARLAARIVEVEAYAEDDPGWCGWGTFDVATGLVRPTGRGSDLFGPPSKACVHLSWGVHWLLNVVTEPKGGAGCLLMCAAGRSRASKRCGAVA